MYKALEAKFKTYENLCNVLLSTKNAWLIEHTKNDKFLKYIYYI